MGALGVSHLCPTAQYRVMLELLPEYQAHPDLLSILHVRSSEGTLIPLDAFATLKTTRPLREPLRPTAFSHFLSA
jgi:HAE1 family hydrophobic/amphiphilic exporter-1